MEIWKEVNGTNGALEVSSNGRVKSNLRDGRVLKPQIDNKGYLRIRVTLDRKRCSFKVHRLVAQAFLSNPECKPQVNHIDGNKQNNHVDNLEWTTNRENVKHAISSGLFEPSFYGAATSNERRKLKVEAINLESGEHMLFSSIADAERYFKTRHITDVLKGKRNSAKGHTFEYHKGVV